MYESFLRSLGVQVKDGKENELDGGAILFAFVGVLAIQALAWGLGAITAALQ